MSADWRRWLAAPGELAYTISNEKVPGINPMKLRRLGGLGNAAVATGRELLVDVAPEQSLSVITISELGELQTNDILIESVVAGTPVSPLVFATSVHNHILGQLCINLDLPCCGGASAGNLETGMVEALSELEMGHWVLVLAFEPHVNEHYARWCGGCHPEYMVGTLLRPDAAQRLRLDNTSAGEQYPVPDLYALRWLALLTGQAREITNRDGWKWTHVDG